jgi:hypothetical protein
LSFHILSFVNTPTGDEADTPQISATIPLSQKWVAKQEMSDTIML